MDDAAAAQRNTARGTCGGYKHSERNTQASYPGEGHGGSGRDGQIRKQQTAPIKSKFVNAIQPYQTIEQQHHQKHKQRMERQFKIVKPDATPVIP
ncbi:hypothetical protein AZE42_12666 [Rhizopogon vesiculosus]|uniref:Syntaxin N-terminal domain-containing protein n=1 Tax=Rhizopogon vesiculosus TaxID=180088 RepID=A0A1J8R277_9AGAM|nr:hypothetical protein AZE42_12666 [Rhizopogon vesiculosus]